MSNAPGEHEAIFRSIPNPIVFRDRDLKVRRCNDAFCKFLGLAEEAVLGRGISEFCPAALAQAIHEADEEVLAHPAIGSARNFVSTIDGSDHVFVLKSNAILDAEGGIRGISGMIDDVTSLVESERKIGRLMRLKDAILAINSSILTLTDIAQLFDLVLEKVLAAMDHANVGCVLLLDADRTLRIASSRGYPRAEAKEFRVRVEDTFQWKKSKGHLEDTCIINDLQEFMKAYDVPADILKDENGFDIKSSMSAPLIIDGDFYGLINLDSQDNNVFDDTDRALAEYVRLQVPIAIGMFRAYGKVKELLAEKELILKEVHHRIKNNMGTINSLLRLQCETLRDPLAVQALEDASSRIRSMVVLYDKLFQADHFRSLSMAYILPSLVDEILSNFSVSPSIKVEKRIDDFEVKTTYLQPLGIIVNEILTNIMKYAFVGRTEGHIVVKAARLGDRARIEIGDDGIGMPDSIQLGHSPGFGLMLIENLTKQINGDIRIERDVGTRFVLEFSC